MAHVTVNGGKVVTGFTCHWTEMVWMDMWLEGRIEWERFEGDMTGHVQTRPAFQLPPSSSLSSPGLPTRIVLAFPLSPPYYRREHGKRALQNVPSDC